MHYIQDALMTFLNNEQNKLNYSGSLLLGLIRENVITKEESVSLLLDLFEELTDSLSKAYTAMLCCESTALLKETVHIANDVSFAISSFSVVIMELENQTKR